jgi:hypothetical protein
VPGDEKQKRRAEIEEDSDFMESLLANKEFCEKIEKKYAIQ